MQSDRCWICTDENVVYTDVLDMAWCADCYNNIYLADE